MFAKFDENGKIVSYADVEKLEDIRPDPEGFEQISSFAETDIWYLVKKNGIVQVDAERKAADIESAKNAKVYQENKQILAKLTEDIVQYVAGEDVPSFAERKSEFIRLHNEVRIYEGKTERGIRTE